MLHTSGGKTVDFNNGKKIDKKHAGTVQVVGRKSSRWQLDVMLQQVKVLANAPVAPLRNGDDEIVRSEKEGLNIMIDSGEVGWRHVTKIF